MRQSIKNNYKTFIALLLLTLMWPLRWAQDSTGKSVTTTQLTTTTTTWYA